jgi:hypothetical protein
MEQTNITFADVFQPSPISCIPDAVWTIAGTPPSMLKSLAEPGYSDAAITEVKTSDASLELARQQRNAMLAGEVRHRSQLDEIDRDHASTMQALAAETVQLYDHDPSPAELEEVWAADNAIAERAVTDPADDPLVAQLTDEYKALQRQRVEADEQVAMRGHIREVVHDVRHLSRRARRLSTVGGGLLLSALLTGGAAAIASPMEHALTDPKAGLSAESARNTGDGYIGVSTGVGFVLGTVAGWGIGERRRYASAYRRARRIVKSTTA